MKTVEGGYQDLPVQCSDVGKWIRRSAVMDPPLYPAISERTASRHRNSLTCFHSATADYRTTDTRLRS